MEGLRLHEAVVFLAAAGLVIPLMKRVRMSSVLGFLLVGLVVGPYGLARLTEELPWLSFLLITDVAGVRALAELGVIFLLFMIGLELSFERLWGMRRLVFGMGSAQIVITAIVIGAVAWGFGNSIEASVLLGGCLALSSTAIVMQLLMEQGRFGTQVGRASFAILLAQDIAVVPILFLVSAFGASQGGSLGLDFGFAVGQALLAILVILGVGRVLVRPLFRFVAQTDSPELFMAVTLLTIIATAAGTHAAGLSAALGAFLAGLLLAECEYRQEIEINMEPFKGLLLGLFFMSVGMGIDLAEIFTRPVWIVLSVAGLFVIKALVTANVARGFGIAWRHAVEMGLLLGQGGEFAFVVVGAALALGLLPDATAQFMLIVVGITMFLSPLVAKVARSAGDLLRERATDDVDEEIDLAADLGGHVIIVGYGRTGQLLASMLDRQMVPHAALDLDRDRVAALRSGGAPVFLGDACRPAMLSKLRLKHAAALAICTDDPGATERILTSARSAVGRVPIIARARDNVHAAELLGLGATRVVPELLESGLQMGHVMMEEIGLPGTVARDLVEALRSEAERGRSAAADSLETST
jgi:CPA2 family monovalent cation:H+ antiporter-2